MEVEEYDVFIPRPHALLASPDGGWVYAGSLGENSVVTVEAESGEAELLRLPGSGAMPHVLVQYAISPDGGTLVATAEMTAKLLVFDVAEPVAPKLVGELDVGRGRGTRAGRRTGAGSGSATWARTRSRSSTRPTGPWPP